MGVWVQNYLYKMKNLISKRVSRVAYNWHHSTVAVCAQDTILKESRENCEICGYIQFDLLFSTSSGIEIRIEGTG